MPNSCPGIIPCVVRILLVVRIEPRPIAHLNFKVYPGVIDSLDRAAVRFGASRSAVARALLQGALERLNCEPPVPSGQGTTRTSSALGRGTGSSVPKQQTRAQQVSSGLRGSS
jgi:hypothetical protein